MIRQFCQRCRFHVMSPLCHAALLHLICCAPCCHAAADMRHCSGSGCRHADYARSARHMLILRSLTLMIFRAAITYAPSLLPLD